MDIDEKYMTEALKEAQLAFEEDEIPIGAGDSMPWQDHSPGPQHDRKAP